MNDISSKVVSPYFSPPRKRQRTPSSSSCEEGIGFNDTTHLHGKRNQTDSLTSHDPLFCFYTRSFTRLLKRLELAKPLLIQGKAHLRTLGQPLTLSCRESLRRSLESPCRGDSPKRHMWKARYPCILGDHWPIPNTTLPFQWCVPFHLSQRPPNQVQPRSRSIGLSTVPPASTWTAH
jgi:hypothetical protein